MPEKCSKMVVAFLGHLTWSLVPAERELRTLAESLGSADEWSDNDPDGHHRAAVPRHRGIDSRRGQMERCASLVPEAGVSSVTPGQTGHDGGGAPSQTPPVEAALRPALEAVERVCECREASRHGNADDLPSAVDPAAPKEKGESKGKGKSKGARRKKGRLE